jgi:hypothetical protein
MLLHPDRLFPADPTVRQLASKFYASVKSLPIISLHGHTQAAWFASNTPFSPPRGTMLHGALTARFLPGWLPNIASTKTKPSIWRTETETD